MKTKRYDYRKLLSAWTLFTTVFLWTPTSRMLFRPDLANWKVGLLEGTGRSAFWWVFPLTALLALFAFYLQGRGRMRGLYHSLLLGWHVALLLLVVSTVLSGGLQATFQGNAWGVEIPLAVLSIPFGLALALAIAQVLGERRGTLTFPEQPWSAVDGRLLIVAAALFIPAAFLYQLGTGFDTVLRLAIVVSIVQWILFAEALTGTGKRRDAIRNPSAVG